jgi:SWI/SNF-related matrix-associated actin-dependent regulator 1 of chromatin subfamily A
MDPTLSIIRGQGSGAKLYIDLKELRPKQRLPILTIFDRIGFRSRGAALVLPLGARYIELLGEVVPGMKLADETLDWYAKRVRWENERWLLKHEVPEPMDEDHVWEALWPFQRCGVAFMSKVSRVLLCDEPGLGKTAQAIYTICLSGRHRKVLVVCPKHLRSFWEQEIVKWWGSHPLPLTTICEAKTRKEDLETWKRLEGFFIVNWELLRLMPELRRGGWQWVVCDEAHRVKNRKTKTFKALKKILAPRLILMTGTPFANNAAEVWTLLNLIRPDVYSSYWRFFEMYVSYDRHPWLGFRRIRGVKHPKLLRRELEPYMLRREKRTVAPDMPPKVYTKVPLKLTARQKELYSDLVRDAMAELADGGELTVPNTISLLTRLRQIVSTTGTLEDTDESTKLDAAVELLKDLHPAKVVVFTQFRKTVELLCHRLSDAGVTNVLLYGGMGAEEVGRIVQVFQEDKDVRVLVATAATGGEGLTLTAASTLVFTEKHYNPAKQVQAEDRIHRIGQEHPCNIISLHCTGTVDDAVEKVLRRKEADINAVLVEEITDHLIDYFEEANRD